MEKRKFKSNKYIYKNKIYEPLERLHSPERFIKGFISVDSGDFFALHLQQQTSPLESMKASEIPDFP